MNKVNKKCVSLHLFFKEIIFIIGIDCGKQLQIAQNCKINVEKTNRQQRLRQAHQLNLQ
jgi:hypothetical protein